MSTWKKATAKRLPDIFDAICQMNYKDRCVIAKCINEMLDELRAEDFFGTEGQCDPRGDPRL